MNGVVCNTVERSVDTQIQRAVFIVSGAGQQVEALHIAPEGGENTSAGAPPIVAGHVIIGNPCCGVGIILVPVGIKIREKLAVTVIDRTGRFGVEAGECQSPAAAVVDIAENIDVHAHNDQHRSSW